MEINDLAKSYTDIKAKRDEKRRVIDFEHARKLKDLESQAFNVESRLRVTVFKNEIKNDEELFDQYEAERQEVEGELKPMLVDVKASNSDRLTTHLYNQVFLDTYLDEQGNIITSSYHKLG